MSRIPPLLLLLVGCESHVDGTPEWGQVWHMSHAPQVFGALVMPERANCTVFESAGKTVNRYEHDGSGALVLQEQNGMTVDLSWRAGCLVGTQVVMNDFEQHLDATCEDGWPVRQVLEASNGVGAITHFENELVDGRLVRQTQQQEDSDFSSTMVLDWDLGRLIEIRGDAFPSTFLRWEDDKLVHFEQAGSITRWDYDAQGRPLVEYEDDKEVVRWTYGAKDDPKPLVREIGSQRTFYTYECR